jgi:hypothetical protein
MGCRWVIKIDAWLTPTVATMHASLLVGTKSSFEAARVQRAALNQGTKTSIIHAWMSDIQAIDSVPARGPVNMTKGASCKRVAQCQRAEQWIGTTA